MQGGIYHSKELGVEVGGEEMNYNQDRRSRVAIAGRAEPVLLVTSRGAHFRFHVWKQTSGSRDSGEQAGHQTASLVKDVFSC